MKTSSIVLPLLSPLSSDNLISIWLPVDVLPLLLLWVLYPAVPGTWEVFCEFWVNKAVLFWWVCNLCLTDHKVTRLNWSPWTHIPGPYFSAFILSPMAITPLSTRSSQYQQPHRFWESLGEHLAYSHKPSLLGHPVKPAFFFLLCTARYGWGDEDTISAKGDEMALEPQCHSLQKSLSKQILLSPPVTTGALRVPRNFTETTLLALTSSFTVACAF